MNWLRRTFITGFFVIVPLIISVAAIVWIFNVIDGSMGPLYARWLGREVPGLGIATTAIVILFVGLFATNVLGRRLLQRLDSWLQRIPVFGTIYSPVKQLVAAFSSDAEGGFKRVVLVQDHAGRAVLGFLTREFTVDRGQGPEPMLAVYVPTNHLYIGDVVVFPRDLASFPDLTVEEAVRIFLTAGVAVPGSVPAHRHGASEREPA